MKTVRQQLQHISFRLSARQMRCQTHTHMQERGEAQAKTDIMKHMKHTHKKHTKAQTAVKHSQPTVKASNDIFALTKHGLTNTHKETHQGAQAGISNRAVYRWATLRGDTVTFQKRMVLV